MHEGMNTRDKLYSSSSFAAGQKPFGYEYEPLKMKKLAAPMYKHFEKKIQINNTINIFRHEGKLRFSIEDSPHKTTKCGESRSFVSMRFTRHQLENVDLLTMIQQFFGRIQQNHIAKMATSRKLSQNCFMGSLFDKQHSHLFCVSVPPTSLRT